MSETREGDQVGTHECASSRGSVMNARKSSPRCAIKGFTGVGSGFSGGFVEDAHTFDRRIHKALASSPADILEMVEDSRSISISNVPCGFLAVRRAANQQYRHHSR